MSEENNEEIVIVTIDQNSVVTFKVEGVKGPSCTDITKPVTDKLGEITEQELTDEYREHTNVQQKGRGTTRA
jgi:hypothetical protein